LAKLSDHRCAPADSGIEPFGKAIYVEIEVVITRHGTINEATENPRLNVQGEEAAGNQANNRERRK